jgi:hypothetical protein
MRSVYLGPVLVVPRDFGWLCWFDESPRSTGANPQSRSGGGSGWVICLSEHFGGGRTRSSSLGTCDFFLFWLQLEELYESEDADARKYAQIDFLPYRQVTKGK